MLCFAPALPGCCRGVGCRGGPAGGLGLSIPLSVPSKAGPCPGAVRSSQFARVITGCGRDGGCPPFPKGRCWDGGVWGSSVLASTQSPGAAEPRGLERCRGKMGSVVSWGFLRGMNSLEQGQQRQL